MMIRVLRETKQLPADIQARIARVGGMTFYGQPNFRIVWGRNVHAGEEDGPYPFAEPDRWYLERWLAPEVCGASRGEYAMCDDAGFLGQRLPDVGVIENFLIPLIERSRGISYRERRSALQAREQRGADSFDKRGMDILNDAGPAFHGAAFSGAAGSAKSFSEKTEDKWRKRATGT